jgi:hypothetical protein
MSTKVEGGRAVYTVVSHHVNEVEGVFYMILV